MERVAGVLTAIAATPTLTLGRLGVLTSGSTAGPSPRVTTPTTRRWTSTSANCWNGRPPPPRRHRPGRRGRGPADLRRAGRQGEPSRPAPDHAGAGPGTVVGLLLPRRADLVVALLAVLKSGAAYLPMETDLPQSRVERLLTDTEPVLVLTAGTTHDTGGAPVIDLQDPKTRAAVGQQADGPVTDADRARP
ncbi:AMP-binding protein [Streptomyces sp. M10(2022)]